MQEAPCSHKGSKNESGEDQRHLGFSAGLFPFFPGHTKFEALVGQGGSPFGLGGGSQLLLGATLPRLLPSRSIRVYLNRKCSRLFLKNNF